ncbi:GntR family transcriptional regulator [Streptomyces sp. NPDC048352]|uniref:GntR family transcriptional regulator n=1 Tax=Streptomyces sp. NPDC048352 TaxID=3154718 RepID=UPI0034411F81
MPRDARTPLDAHYGTDDPHALRERVHETLLVEITSGELPPGTLLGEGDTARRLDVAQVRVREALLTLASQRLIEYSGPDRAHVTHTSTAEARHTATVLHGLYRTALLTAPWPLTGDRVEAVRNCAAAHTRAASAGDGAEALACALALWDTVLHTCANPPLHDAVSHLKPVWQRAHRVHLSPSGVGDADWGPFLTACATGDRTRALHHLDHHWGHIDRRLTHAAT